MSLEVEPRRKISPEEYKKMRDKDHKMVRGKFRCMEPPGGSVTFSYRKYKGDQIQSYTMVDGESYTIPLMVAKHLNQDCAYPKHSHVLDADGKPSQQVGKWVRRFGFESLEFYDEEDAVVDKPRKHTD